MDEFLINNAVQKLKLVTNKNKIFKDKELSGIIKKAIEIRNAIVDLGKRVGSANLVEQAAMCCFFHQNVRNFKLTEKEAKKLAAVIAFRLKKMEANLADWTGEFINDKNKKEKFFLFERKSRGIEEKYKLTKSILNCPEADMLGNKEIMSNFFEKIFLTGKAEIITEDESFLINSTCQFLEKVKETGKKGMTIQRYKGLGEMNPDQLWETTMKPEGRTLLQVRAEDDAEADSIFTTLMGDQVAPRRKFIEDHALDVKNLDV